MTPLAPSRDTLKYDIPAGIVVFLVALPLCLGIALASNAPLFSGIISGIIGGIIVSIFTGSPLSVSGPAAGLILTVIDGAKTLGSFEALCAATLIAGVLQVVFGLLRAGAIGEFVPVSVIRGMLAAIGIVIILKQIPHALGRDIDFGGDEAFLQPTTGENSITGIIHAFSTYSVTATALAIVSLLTLVFWDRMAKRGRLALIPAPLVVVVLSVLAHEGIKIFAPSAALSPDLGNLVQLPVAANLIEFANFFNLPSFDAFLRFETYIVAATLAVVASIETLLSVEATDKIDPYRRISNTNRELFAQGAGNIVSGLLGGLPITAVIVRSSANVYAGARTQASGFTHGVLLLLAAGIVPSLLNQIPLSALAAILILLGYKLASPKIFKEMYQRGAVQFAPFLITIVAVTFTDLLTGVLIGVGIGLLFVIKANHHFALTVVHDENNYLMRLNKDMSFIHRAEVKEQLLAIPDGAHLVVDGAKALYIDRDILDVFNDFARSAPLRDVTVEFKHIGERNGSRLGAV